MLRARFIVAVMAASVCLGWTTSSVRAASQEEELFESMKLLIDSIVERSVVLQGARIGDGCVVRDAIVAAGARIGDGTHITGGAVLGEGVTIGADCVVTRGARVFPGVEIPDGGLRF